MIGKEDNQEEVTFKVADRRKFNPDGSLKEGVTLEPAKPEEKAEPAAAKTDAASGPEKNEPERESAADNIPQEEDEIPGVDDPASFINFLSTLATNAAAALGAVPHPATGKRTVDLDTGKYWLDVLGMLRDKTKGNLHKEESRLLDGLLADLRMQYVQLVGIRYIREEVVLEV
jgi:Domain of unknown function (DUF1844)